MDFNKKIVNGKTFNELLTKIWENSEKKEKQISDLIKQLQPMVKEPGDAMLLVPLLKEYIEVAIKNDEQLIKMASIIQKAMAKQSEDESDMFLSDKDRNELFESARQLKLN